MEKKELEDAAVNSWLNYEHVEGHLYSTSYKNGFKAGAQYQAERSYSEEEVRKISLDFFHHWWNSKGTNTEQKLDNWFEQFKKTKHGK